MMKHTIEIIDDDEVDSLLDKLTALSVEQQKPKSDMDYCLADILELKKRALQVNDPPPLSFQFSSSPLHLIVDY